jgi:2,4-dienoyl-CoA reductase-like NADH-dependent reductase (Old Yellow Enzyme family)
MGSKLFSPLELRGLTLPNRIVVSPMAQFSADGGRASPWHLMHLGSLAISGAALVITEASAVHPNGLGTPGDLGLWCDEQAEALEPALAFCRRHGKARLGMQLYHSGRKGSITIAWEGQRFIPKEQGGWATYAPSAIAYAGRAAPIPLDRKGIDDVIESFVAAARRADRLGFDVLELHAAHGYLLHNFLSPLTNHRGDEFGGSAPKRMRFALDTFNAVREVWPERKVLGVRVSATDWAQGGCDIEDSIEFSRALREAGCDYVCASSGGAVPDQKLSVSPGYQVPFAARIRDEAGIPTMAVGLITEARQAEEIVANGHADLVALGRAMLFDPRWPWHAALELGEKYFCPPQYLRSHPAMRAVDFLKPTLPA